MRSIFIVILAVIVINTLSFAGNDTLSHYSIDELVFHSPLEKDAFDCLLEEQSCHYMKNALATDETVTHVEYQQYKKHFYEFLDEVKEHRRFQRKPERQIRYIFNAIHDEYFRLYQETPHFSDIFTHGVFNCATASVLYALAFEYYSIPYDIILIPEHVYLLAYPQQHSILVETTNPLQSGFRAINQREKARAVQSLVDRKLLLQEEVNRKGIDRIFNEMFHSEDIVNLHELIGILYLNKASVKSDMVWNTETYEFLKKSSVFYPDQMTTVRLLLNASIILDQSNYKDSNTYRTLADLEKFTSFGITHNDIIQQGVFYINRALSDNNEAVLDSIHQWFNRYHSVDEIISELNFVFYYNKSLKLINEYRVDEALPLLEAAYMINPDDHNLNILFIDVLTMKLKSGDSKDYDYEWLSSMANRIPELMDNKRFQTLYQGTLLDLVNHHYVRKNFEMAEKFRSDFERIFAPEDLASPNIIRYLEEVYSRASLLYFRKNFISRAKAVLVSGLEYAPYSMELKDKLDYLR
ncbi:MAG: hypothetical protein ABR597_09005 [Bacteroidales bacterium]